jgi:hypothetical protein
MSNKTDIVFFHIGKQEYVLHTIKQVKSSNPNATIHFIGDNVYPAVLEEVEFYPYEDLVCDQAFNFLKWFENYSTNDHDFEKICILRWFCIRNLWREKEFKSVFYADCDIMIYCDLNEESEKFKEYLFSIAASTSAHSTFINTIDVLDDFCNLVEVFYCSPTHPLKIAGKQHNIALYKQNTVNEYSTRRKHELAGGVSDMKFWGKMKLLYPAGAVGEMCEVRGDPFFVNGNITMSAPDTYTQTEISLPLDSLNREGVLVHAVYFTADEPERIVNSVSTVTCQLTATSKTALVGANDANLIGRKQTYITGGAAEFSGPHVVDLIGDQAPYSTDDNLMIIATDNVFFALNSVAQVAVKSGQFRMVCSRIKLSADAYAALVTNELSS